MNLDEEKVGRNFGDIQTGYPYQIRGRGSEDYPNKVIGNVGQINNN